MAAIKKLLKKSYTVKDVNALMTESLFRPVNGKTLGEKDAAKAIVKVAAQTGANVSPAVVKMAALKANPAPKRKTAARTQRAAEAYVRRPSQITKKAPSKRLKKRRTVNLQSPRGVFPNPSPREVDEVYAREIFLYGQNDGDLYRQQTTYIIDNLAKKYAKGQYDHALGRKAWRYWADNATKKYGAELVGQKTGFIVNVPTRNLIAELAENYYFDHVTQESAKFAPGKTLRKNPGQRGKKFIFVKKAPTNSPNRFSVVAYFHDTPDGAKDAIEYAKAYHRKQPEYIIKVETGVL